MPAVRHGAQWASGSPESTTPHPREARPRSAAPSSRSTQRRGRATLGSLVAIAALVFTATIAAPAAPTRAASDYLLMSRSELLALPTSGTAWTALKQVADGSLGSPDLCDINSDHHLRTLAAALVYARTGTASYASKAHAGIMAAMPTQKNGCGDAALALGRQLAAYVLAADFSGLSGSDDSTFRSWLSTIRTKDIGGHSVWDSLANTQHESANNWGAHAGASRIAASLYLGDTNDVAIAARITRGFLGERSQYASFGYKLDSDDLSWSCWSASTYTPLNHPCTKSGIDLDGAIIADISRSGPLEWPPGGTAIAYQVDSIAALAIQLELLSRHGYPDAWDWSDSALRRAAQLVVRSGQDGGDGWNETSASSQIPWLLNQRYGSFLPTRHVAMGRGIGFADWLWGGGTGVVLDPPTVTKPTVRLSTTSSVPSSGQPVVVGWGLAKSADGLSKYELQWQQGSGSWKNVKLPSSKSTSVPLTVSTSVTHAFRVRATDRSGRVGPWNSIGAQSMWRVSDSSAYVHWTGTWSYSSKSSYLDGKLHASTAKNSTVTFTFSGTGIAWVSPTGSGLGQGQVYLDGTYVKTVDLKGSSSASRKIVFATSLSNGSHTIRIVVVGTSGRPKVAVDGFYVVKPV